MRRAPAMSLYMSLTRPGQFGSSTGSFLVEKPRAGGLLQPIAGIVQTKSSCNAESLD
jgi:hypothetical protein